MRMRGLSTHNCSPARRARPICPSRTGVNISLGASHVPNNDLLRGIVLPDQIRDAVLVEIGRTHYSPSWEAGGQPVRSLIDIPLGAAHVPHDDLSRGVILPDEIWHAVLIEIGGTHHF